MKKVISYLTRSIPYSAILNLIWHMSSTTECTTAERLAGWSLVWFLVSVCIWSIDKAKEKYTESVGIFFPKKVLDSGKNLV
jgi:hypothetical protein